MAYQVIFTAHDIRKSHSSWLTCPHLILNKSSYREDISTKRASFFETEEQAMCALIGKS